MGLEVPLVKFKEVILMAETIEKAEQAENTKVESTENNQEQTESVSIADKNEFLQNFIKDNDTQSIEEAKIKDKISMLEAKIKDIKATKSSQNDTIQACKTVIDSNTYPKLNPIISSFSAHLEKLDKKKDKKIVKKENQLKKAQRKLVKLQRKQKRSKLLKNFISAMVHSSSNKQEAYINAMQALKEDSLGRADRQLDKANSKLNRLNAKLNSSTLGEVDKLKIKSQIKKVESKRDTLISRINNLNELEQELNKLAKIELVDNKIDELRNTAVETAEKAAMNGSSVSETIDNVAETSSEVIKEVLEPDKVKEAENDMSEEQNKQTENQQEETKQAEVEAHISEKEQKGEDKPQTNVADQEQKIDDKPQEKKTQTNSNNYLKKTGLTQKQLLAILNTGIAVKVAETIPDKEYTVAFTKENKEKINQVLEAVNTQIQGKHMMR